MRVGRFGARASKWQENLRVSKCDVVQTGRENGCLGNSNQEGGRPPHYGKEWGGGRLSAISQRKFTVRDTTRKLRE